MFEQPCLKAHFVEIIKGGSCNYFSQRQIDHLTIDGQRRISKTLPDVVDLIALIDHVGKLRNKFDIGAFSTAGSEPLWTLDLSQMFKYLTKLVQHSDVNGKMNFRGFLDSLFTGVDTWQKCVKELNTHGDLLVSILLYLKSHDRD